MIAKTYIHDNLTSLDRRYRAAQSAKEALFFSKLAVIELCGWIEESMDDVVLRCSVRSLLEPANRKYVTKKVVRRNHGFSYENHFRRMLIQLIGIVSVEWLERQVDPIKRDKLVATLSALKTMRDAEAHTYLKGVTRHINSPSVTLAQFPDVYDGLREFERVIRSTKF